MSHSLPRVPAAIEAFFAGSQVPLTLTAADHPDQPLLLVNAAFEALSGYRQDEVAGRNCRFLQSDLPNEQARAEIRQALATGEDLQVVLRNRRKDGTPFDNLLFLYALRSGGRVTHFLGSQFELKHAWSVDAIAERIRNLDDGIARVIDDTERLRANSRRLVADSVASYARLRLGSAGAAK